MHRAATLLEWDCEEGRRAYGRIIPTGPEPGPVRPADPVGPVAAFVPWNFPAGGPMRKIAAALAAGCSIVIKPSEEVPGTVCLLAQAFADAGLPPGVLNLVFGVPDEISAHGSSPTRPSGSSRSPARSRSASTSPGWPRPA